MTEHLLPCPFCGSPAKRHDIEAREDVDNAGASYIECAGCGACTQLHFDRKENLYDSWNRRYDPAKQSDAPMAENITCTLGMFCLIFVAWFSLVYEGMKDVV